MALGPTAGLRFCPWLSHPRTTHPHSQHPVPSKMGRFHSCPLLPSLPGPACSGNPVTLLQQGGTRESALRHSGWGQASKFSAGILDHIGLPIPPSMERRDPRPLFLPTNHCYLSFQIISEPPASFPYVTESVHFRNRLIFFPICSRLSASPSRVLLMPRSSILCQETFHSHALRSLTVSRNALGTLSWAVLTTTPAWPWVSSFNPLIKLITQVLVLPLLQARKCAQAP